MFKQEKMREVRKKLLDESGYVWSVGSGVVVDDGRWMEQCGNLKLYKKKYGHCNVPRNEGRLGVWVENQRQLHRKNTIKNDRKDIPDEIGFVWEPTEEKWQKKYKKLEEFRETHGHGNLSYADNNALLVWIRR
jgi:hypothetical protein